MPVDEDKIRVTAIQRLCVHDGPGVRTTVFLKGCYLQCPWCCNPETIRFDDDFLFDKGICRKDASSSICKDCLLLGHVRPKELCPLGSYEKTFTDYTVNELYGLLMRDRHLYENGGGVTFSGGEPLRQASALIPLLQGLKKNNVQVAFETSIYAPNHHLRLVMPYVDYWLIDLKYQYGYIPNPFENISDIDVEQNLSDIQSSVPANVIRYRMVVMKEILEKFELIVQKLKNHQIGEIELLAYHYLGENKYKELGKTFHRFGIVSKKEMESCGSIVNRYGIIAKYLSL